MREWERKRMGEEKQGVTNKEKGGKERGGKGKTTPKSNFIFFPRVLYKFLFIWASHKCNPRYLHVSYNPVTANPGSLWISSACRWREACPNTAFCSPHPVQKETMAHAGSSPPQHQVLPTAFLKAPHCFRWSYPVPAASLVARGTKEWTTQVPPCAGQDKSCASHSCV